MASDRFKIDTIKPVLRELYPVAQLAALKAYRLTVFNSATDQIILTGSSSEGGSQHGEVYFPRLLVLAAVNELIDEYDPFNAAIPGTLSPDWRFASPV